jgi:pimeloyl-ACP methyl ester carboxylesterase
MTLGGVADGGTYLLARGLRQARSDTIGVNDVLVPAPAGLRGTLPDRRLHVVSRGSEPRSRSSRCPKIRTKPPLLNSRKPAALAELAAIREWGVIPKTDRFAVLGQIHHPTLIVHGSKDVVVTPINAFLLAQHLPNAQLIMYPDANHGAYAQYAENFLENARLFLNG